MPTHAHRTLRQMDFSPGFAEEPTETCPVRFGFGCTGRLNQQILLSESTISVLDCPNILDAAELRSANPPLPRVSVHTIWHGTWACGISNLLETG